MGLLQESLRVLRPKSVKQLVSHGFRRPASNPDNSVHLELPRISDYPSEPLDGVKTDFSKGVLGADGAELWNALATRALILHDEISATIKNDDGTTKSGVLLICEGVEETTSRKGISRRVIFIPSEAERQVTKFIVLSRIGNWTRMRQVTDAELQQKVFKSQPWQS